MDDGAIRAEIEVMLLDIQRNNEAMGRRVAQIASDQEQSLRPILQDIIERQAIALSRLL